jgi:uncharacterized repeat protein (TIGR01451 family)
VSFIVTQPGRQCHRLDVTADGGHAAGARACVTGIAAVVTPPQLSVRVTGAPNRRAGEVAAYSIEVRNAGSAPATNVLLAVTWGPNMDLLEATQGHEDNIPRLTTQWRIAQIGGGETQTRQLNFACRQPDEQGAAVRATVSSQQTGPVSSQAATVISPASLAAPRPAPVPPSAAPIRPEAAPSQPPAQPVAGSLKITALLLANPIAVGGNSTLQINLINDRNVPDRDVALSVQSLSDGLTIRVAGPTPTPVAASSPAALDFSSIREIRAGEQLPAPYRIEVRGVRPGRYTLRISAISALGPTGVTTNVDLVVNP